MLAWSFPFPIICVPSGLHANAGTLWVTFEGLWEQQLNHALIKAGFLGDWCLMNETESTNR